MSDTSKLSEIFGSESITTLFSINGKTMIGKFITYPKGSVVGAGTNLNPTDKDSTGIFTKLLGNSADGTIDYSKYYFVKNPAEIIYDLQLMEEGTAKLKWSVVPFVYKTLKIDQTRDVVVAYEKSSVIISDATADTLKSGIVNAYNEIA